MTTDFGILEYRNSIHTTRFIDDPAMNKENLFGGDIIHFLESCFKSGLYFRQIIHLTCKFLVSPLHPLCPLRFSDWFDHDFAAFFIQSDTDLRT